MSTEQNSIRLNKLIRASRQRVYEAWTDPEIFRQWWAADPNVTDCEIQLDARVGGEIRISMEHAGQPCNGRGRFESLEPGRRIAFSWGWDNIPGFNKDTRVTIELLDADNPYDDGPATELVFTHAGLLTAFERNEHLGGWWESLRALGYVLRGIDPRQTMYAKATADA